MSSANDSIRVIVIAFFANLGIASAKFFGAFYSGSASMLAEAIHSLVDCSNQVLLIIGSKKSKKPADDLHPLGYGRESFFWSFIVAILLFSLGGLFAIYEGAHKLNSNEAVNAPILGLGILLVSLALEGYSFYACLKEVQVQNTFGSIWTWLRKTKNSELLVIFTEDLAALTGLLIATICLTMAWLTNNSFWDAMGSILVGAILVIVAVLLAAEVKSFLIGESSDPELRDFVESEIGRLFTSGKLLRFISLQTGSSEIMISYKVFPGKVETVAEAIQITNVLEKSIKSKFPAIRWQFVELDDKV